MTFSIVGRCAETGQLGIAISSSSIAVGARCPWVRGGVGAVATQNITLPALGPEILDLLEAGESASSALDKALTRHGYSQYRQVAVIDQHGATALFTGSEALGVHNALAGEQCVAAGNLLASPQVIAAMVQAFAAASGELLADRLLAALRVARGDVADFVAEHGGEDALAVEAVERIGIGMANAGRHDLDQHFAGLGAFEIELDDFERLLGSKGNGGAGLHGALSPVNQRARGTAS